MSAVIQIPEIYVRPMVEKDLVPIINIDYSRNIADISKDEENLIAKFPKGTQIRAHFQLPKLKAGNIIIFVLTITKK